jgi:hypothetical protein
MKFVLESDSDEYGFYAAILVPHDGEDNYSFESLIFDSETSEEDIKRAVIFIENHEAEIIQSLYSETHPNLKVLDFKKSNTKEIEYDDRIVQVREILDKHNFFSKPYWFGNEFETYQFVLDLIKGMSKTSDLAKLATQERLHGNTSNSLRDLNVTIDLLNDLNNARKETTWTA